MRTTLLLLAATMPVLSGCSAFLPPHTHSNQREGELVSIELLDKDAARALPGFVEDYEAAFGPHSFEKSQESRFEEQAAAGAAALVGLAIDFVGRELEREAELYEAQFGNSLVRDDFWRTEAGEDITVTEATRLRRTDTISGVNSRSTTLTRQQEVTRTVTAPRLVQRYYGVVIRRSVKDAADAFTLVCGIAPSADQQMFRIEPLQFRTTEAKAKVLSDQWGWWLLPTTWLRSLLRTSGRELDTSVAIEMDGYTRNQKQELAITKVAALTLQLPRYDLSERAWCTTSGRKPPLPADANADQRDEWEDIPVRRLPLATSGWLVAVPISYGLDGSPIDSPVLGNFSLRATVTERDPSNAKAYLEKAAEFVAGQRDRAVEETEKAVRRFLEGEPADQGGSN